jgi:hypothetical protein
MTLKNVKIFKLKRKNIFYLIENNFSLSSERQQPQPARDSVSPKPGG